MIRAIVIEEEQGKPRGREKQIAEHDLPPHGVLVDVAFSSLNYKDGLAISGKGKIARKLPMVGGIDLAGTVKESASPDWKPGDKVVVTGWGLSEIHWGGYAQKMRVQPEWLVRLPDGLDLKQSMSIGTAGLTSMLCVMAIEDAGVVPGEREVLVTGAAGGVGSVAVALLAKRGYRVAASTGRPETHDYLRSLGASSIVPREELSEKSASLRKERWAGAIDSVGGQTLSSTLSQIAYGGAVAACGLAGGADFPGSVFPFILRNVSLLGVDSVMAPKSKREAAWKRLAADLPLGLIDKITTVEPMTKLPELAEQIVAGKVRGRVVIDVHA